MSLEEHRKTVTRRVKIWLNKQYPSGKMPKEVYDFLTKTSVLDSLAEYCLSIEVGKFGIMCKKCTMPLRFHPCSKDWEPLKKEFKDTGSLEIQKCPACLGSGEIGKINKHENRQEKNNREKH